MTNTNLENIIKKGENEQVEFKTSFADIGKILATISAFANTKGGRIIVGVSDEGEFIGTTIGKDTLEKIPQKIKESIDPVIFPSIITEKVQNKNIVILDVPPAYEKPVFFKNIAYKRVGKANRKISASEIRSLVKDTTEKTYWDKQVCSVSSLSDIDWDYVENEFIPLYEEISGKKMIGNPKELLKSLGCLKDNIPTNAGVLFFGKSPQSFFINSFIAIAKYKGENIDVERLDYKEFAGNLFRQIDKCYNYIKENISIMSKLPPYQVRREDIPEYGLFSIRELITNAVCHRDYFNQHTKVIIKIFSDRIEFYNPGGLPSEITPENITEKQYSRNPVIAKILSKIEYIEELGEGWNKIIDEHKSHPLKPQYPSIKSDNESIKITLYSTKEKFEEEKLLSLSERQKKILKYLKNNNVITRSVCMKLLGVSKDTSLRELSGLKEKNIIEQIGIGRGIYYRLK